MDTVNSLNRIQMHYSFNDETHYMDAFIKHRCENEILSVLKEIENVLGIHINIEKEAVRQGGLKEIWKIVSKNKYLMGIVTGIVINILSTEITKDHELIEMQKQALSLEIEQRRIELAELEDDKDAYLSEEDLNVLIEIYSKLLNIDEDIIKHKSKFYNNLNTYSKIRQIGIQGKYESEEYDLEEIVIRKDDFEKYINKKEDAVPDVDEEAIIEVIAPYLQTGKYHWRGIYKNEPIDFYMKDSDFKKSIINKEIKFFSGTKIIGILSIAKETDELGNEKIKSYSLNKVLSYEEIPGIKKETYQGRTYRKIKKEAESQIKLFSESELKQD